MNHYMARITVDIPDADLQQIDAEAKQQKVSRSKCAAIAIDAHLHQKSIIDDATAMRLKDQLDAKTKECDAQSQKIAEMGDALLEKGDEIDRLKQQIRESGTEATQRWEELKGVRNENTKLKKDLDAAQATIQRLQAELHDKQAEMDQIAAMREELTAAKTDRDRLREALKVRDDDIDYFKSHISQLTQTISQLSLKPGEEEIKKKDWWQFWR